jgi:hypothetical protein
MLTDEESVRFVIGDSFVHLDKDAAEERLNRTTKEHTAEVETIQGKIKDISEQLQVGAI